MAENELKQIISQLDSLKANNLQQAPQLLSRAKLALLHLNALVPSEKTQQQHLALAAAVLELGALISIKLKDTEAFTRYFQQLQPFYAVPEERWGSRSSGRQNNQSKVTGLYLLLLLSVGDYAGFHTVLEGLEMSRGKEQIDKDEFIQYPVRLEQALMEGSYDKVWSETKGERVPSEEYAVFSEVRQSSNQGSRCPVVLFHKCAHTFCRFWSTPSAPKSPRAPSERTHLCPYQTLRTFSSSIPRARSSSSHSREGGWQRMEEFTFRSRKKKCSRRRRM
jgi:hypothetical protein